MPQLDRRHVLEWLVASPLIAAPLAYSLAGGEAHCQAASRTTNREDPIAAWRQPGAGERDPRRFALAHAILAPNPHNRQPWLISLEGSDTIIFNFDTDRRLPVTDPFDRQLTIGCGAFLELLSLASAQAGYEAKIELFPAGQPGIALDKRPIAKIQLVAGGAKSPLFNAIEARRSNKEAYDKKKPIPPQIVRDLFADVQEPSIATFATLTNDPMCEALRSISKRAYRREVETPLALKESVDLIRLGKAEIAQYRDGIDIDFPFLSVLVATGQVTKEKMMIPGTAAYRQGLENYDPLANSAGGYIWMTSDSNDRISQITVGRAYARLNLRATQLGLSIHPMSQALQEYEEIADINAEINATLGIAPTKTLQMLARIGYGPAVPPAPRRGLSEHMVE
jgi:Nitroreductase family